jgi:type I restriction-modification system DNA methylase subunit
MYIYLVARGHINMANKKKYIENLQKLDFQTDQEYSPIYFVGKQTKYIKQNISPYIIIALDKAEEFGVDAVYFRFFDDERPPLAQIYIYDNITKQKHNDYYAQKHKEIWSSCEIAIFFIIDKSTIRVYDSRNPVEICKEGLKSEPIEIIDLLAEVNTAITKYKAQNFNNGSFWENENAKNHFLNSKTASEKLVKGFREIRNELYKGKLLSIESIDEFLMICILIKYLEETGIDKSNDKNYAHIFFKKVTGHEHLEDIIRNNKLSYLLSALSKHFNGGIFDIDETFKQELDKTDIRKLARFFEANFKNNLFGWKEYSFEHIPVELISNFYEELIPKYTTQSNEKSKKDTGAVYTPSFLVNLLVDECLSLKNLDKNEKLIDPACGSGIFLVTAYKRLVQRWRIKHKRNKLANTNPKILKEILTKNIFGIDVNPNSVNLSIFSLQLALCSMLTPKQIWTELRFVDLRKNKNIIQKDFFEYLVEKDTPRDFDLVIGNPPFKRKELDGKNYKYYNNLLKNDFQIKFENTPKEFALLFLEKSMHLLKKKKGKLCLILPSGPMLYTDDSLAIRKTLFGQYNVSQIIDFTFLRRVLFQATVASLAIFVDCMPPTDSPITHITAKRTKQSKERFYFEFDHYDFYEVPKELVTDKINIWKCNLLGGYRVCDIIDKFNKIKVKLKNFCIDNNISIQNNDIRKADVFSEIEMKIYKKSLFSSNEIIPKKNNKYLGIRKTIKGSFPTEITIDDFKEKDKIDAIGFKGSIKSIDLLKDYIKKHSEWICFYIAAVSGRQGIRSPYTIYSSDFEHFPYLDNLNDYLADTDKIIIDDVVKYTLDEFGNGEKSKINIKIATSENLINFSKVYCKALNSIYHSDNKKYTLTNITEGDAYFICEIQYVDNINIPKPKLNKINKSLNALLIERNESQSSKINKIVRFYGNNVIRIIKPKQLRFWLKSKALRDADETFDDILNNEL